MLEYQVNLLINIGKNVKKKENTARGAFMFSSDLKQHGLGWVEFRMLREQQKYGQV